MSRTTRFHPRRPLVVTGFILTALAVSAATAQAQSTSPQRALLDQIPAATYLGDLKSAYFAGFTGADAAGRDMVWRGAVAGAAVGELVVRLAPEGGVIDSTTSDGPVEGIIFVSGEDPRQAFAAEVRGTINWKSKRATLTGVVSTGYLSGTHIELTADVINDALHGELRLVPATHAGR